MLRVTVYYEDTDVGGIVYHSNYLNFCERARSDVFFQKGLSPILKNGHFVAKRVEADYIKSAKLGDELKIKTELLEMKQASFKLLQTVYLNEMKIFKLIITLAYINFDGRPQKIDSDTKELISSLFE
jgi:acyl-CoA thioester hydrolase